MPDTNLIPVHRRLRRHRRDRLRLWSVAGSVLGALVAVASLGARAWCGRQDLAIVDKSQQTGGLVREYEAAIRGLRLQLDVAEKAKEMSQVLCLQPDWSRLLSLLTAELGEEIVLSQLELVTLSEKDTEMADTPSAGQVHSSRDAVFSGETYRIRLTGLGRTQYAVSQLLLRLENLSIFDIVRLSNTSRKPVLNQTAVGFSIECWIR